MTAKLCHLKKDKEGERMPALIQCWHPIFNGVERQGSYKFDVAMGNYFK